MTSRFYYGASILSTVLAIFIAASPAFASDSYPSSEKSGDILQLPQVTVTATRIEREIAVTPSAVSVIGADEMELRQVQSLSDILQDVPGVDFGGGPRSLGQVPSIRGMGGSRILIMVDGVRQNFSSGHKGRIFVEPDLLKAVEVLRGPGSALYGDALGGVIAMTTKDAIDFLSPGEHLGLRIKGGFQEGSQEWLGSTTLVGQLKDGRLDYLLNATYRDSDDIRLGGGGTLDASAEETVSDMQKVNLRPGHHVITFQRQFLYKRGDIPVNTSVVVTAGTQVADRETLETIYRVAYTYNSPQNAWLHPSLSVYRDDLRLNEKRFATGQLDTTDFVTDGVDVRNTLSFDLGPNVNNRLTLGAEYYRDGQEATDGLNKSERLSTPDAEGDHYGVYLQIETELSDWVVISGLRWDTYGSESESQTADIRDDAEATNYSPRIAIVYKASEILNLTASYGESFRFPRFGELFLSGAHAGGLFIPNPDLKPEEGKTWEAGIRLATEDVIIIDELSLNLNTYYSEFDGLIAADRPGVTFALVNLNEVKTYGIELEGSYWLAMPDIQMSLSASLQRGDETDENGEEKPFRSISGDKVVLNLSKRFEEQGLTFGARGTLRRRQDRVPDDFNETPGYGLVDLYGTWEPETLPDLRVDFGVDNVGDKKYQRHGTQLAEMGRNSKISASYQYHF